MSDLEIIEQTLAKVAGRRRKDRALKGFWQGVFVGSILCFLALGVYKLAPIPSYSLKMSLIVAAMCPLFGLIAGGWRRNSVSETARWVDGRVKLQERLSSALEFAAPEQTPDRWKELLVSDAASHVKEVDPRDLVKYRFPKITRWALLLIGLCIGLGFVPEYRSKAYVQKDKDSKIIKEAGKQLVELTKKNLAAHKPAIEPTQKSMEAVAELGDQLTKRSLTRSEALQKIASVADKLKDQMKDVNQDSTVKRLEQAARSPGGQTSPEAAKLQKQIADAQKQMGGNNATPDDMEKVQKELSKLQQEATKASADNGGKMSQADREKLSKSMSALSKQAQDMGMQMPNLDQAMEALANNQTDMMLKDLKQATFDLEKTKEMAKNLQAMQQQMEKMGKDLGEQLKNGQQEEAQSTLNKMMKDLKSADLTPEQMKKLLSEVSKAVDPASKYGEVAKHLKDAAKGMKDGDKANASQSLAKAAEELKKLGEQMGDAQSMAEELEALNKASESVGTGKSWGQCQGTKPGTGNGGKPGRGVGTWADENAGWGYDGTQSDRWDNSGLVQKDQNARGLTDRPSDLNDALKPTKVKGQFSPGGQMPSITLKGVSIKGQSKVAYEEAAVAAQADAQSALSQEKVPRAYQAPVRDYFDDLKK